MTGDETKENSMIKTMTKEEVLSFLSVLGQILKSGVYAETQQEVEHKICELLKRL